MPEQTLHQAAEQPNAPSNQASVSTDPALLPAFVWPRTVRWVDTDASGMAHLGSYVRMMEETEYAFLRSRGLRVVLDDEKGTMGFPRLSCQITVHEPLSFDQEVIVVLRLVKLDGKQVVYDFKIYAKPCVGISPSDTEPVLVEGKFAAAFCRFPDKQPPYAILMPEFVLAALSPELNSSSDSEPPESESGEQAIEIESRN